MAEPSSVVVIAVDASKKAEYAVNFYYDNLHKQPNKIVFVTIVELPADSVDARKAYMTPATFAKVWEQEEQKCQMLEAKYVDLAKQKGATEVKFRMEGGMKPGQVIVQTAEEEKASMIVMGTRGMGSVRRTILGSVSDYVVHHAHCPVVVCRKQKEEH